MKICVVNVSLHAVNEKANEFLHHLFPQLIQAQRNFRHQQNVCSMEIIATAVCLSQFELTFITKYSAKRYLLKVGKVCDKRQYIELYI
jgi:hypothetical protein